MSRLAIVGLCLAFGLVWAEVQYFDSLDGTELTREQAYAKDDETRYWCVNEVETACPMNEGRRIGGSCNNLKYPAAGTLHHKFERLLDGDYAFDENGRLEGGAKTVRRLRTAVAAMGEVPSSKFTQLLILYSAFTVKDIANMLRQDALAYIVTHRNCCTTGRDNPQCYPLEIPADDPVHRFSGNRCMNLTYTFSYVSQGCRKEIPFEVPERLNFGTPYYDLGQVYGNLIDTSNRQRLFKGGLLNTTTAFGVTKPWPALIPGKNDRFDGIQSQSSPLFQGASWHWLEHNRIAHRLAELNPKWDDEKLFSIAKDINIAQYVQIVFYEMWASLLGREHLIKDGILSSDAGFRDEYDGSKPEQYVESLYAWRWIHAMIEGFVDKVDIHGNVVGKHEIPSMPLSWNLTTQGFSDTMPLFNQGAFRQATSKQDNILDPQIAERATAHLQVVSDLGSIDIAKGRLFGMPKYPEILKYVDGKNHYSWKSLKPYISDANIEVLKGVYSSPAEIDTIVGMWLEELKPNSWVPQTVYSLLLPQFLNNIRGDRHWYERPNRPNAFNAAQLAEIRKATLSRLMCDHAETISVTGVTARPLELISKENPILSCDHFPQINLDLWKDSTC